MAFQWEPNSKAPRARKFELTPLHLYEAKRENLKALEADLLKYTDEYQEMP